MAQPSDSTVIMSMDFSWHADFSQYYVSDFDDLSFILFIYAYEDGRPNVSEMSMSPREALIWLSGNSSIFTLIIICT